METSLLMLVMCFVGVLGSLYPRASETREVRTLDGVWEFRISPADDPNVGFREKWYAKPLKQSGGEILMMPVPASYNDITARADIRDFVGVAWYERNFFVPAAWLHNNKARVKLRFGSVHYAASVWVNSHLAVEHIGGHLPFEADITSFLHPTANRLTVAVNNTLDSYTIPQGSVIRPNDTDKYPPGYVINSYTFDFYNYAGIHRPVVLHMMPTSYVDDILVTSSIDNQQNGIIKFAVSVRNNDIKPLSCQVQILDDTGNPVAKSNLISADNCSRSLLVNKAHLWWPLFMSSSPGYLYTLEVTLRSDTKKESIDIYRLPFGIRTIQWTKSTILINGKPFYFRGFGRHEDLNVRGKGLDLVMLVKDHNIMKWLGANSYRTSHYPYSEENLELSDRLGLVVVSESPAVNLEVFDKPLLARHRAVMRELIQRDKNRACVLMWSIANEPRSQQPESEAYFKDIASYVKYLDPTRPITMAINQKLNNDHGAQFMDVIAINRYFAWYSDTGRLELIARQMESEVRKWKQAYNKPIFISEYGADAISGLHMDPPTVWTENYQVALMKENFRAFDKLREEGLLNGEMIWNFADFATAQVYTRVNGNKKGIFTRERQPKAAAHTLRERYHKLAKQLDKFHFDDFI